MIVKRHGVARFEWHRVLVPKGGIIRRATINEGLQPRKLTRFSIACRRLLDVTIGRLREIG